ncbi:sulfatase-like hydrolase/transferase [uncultured Draconibacterium sp.]|uniref:sulfatase-like hydrolase/transferase n=1 Tax=uncultured Draconibacterium sp. TaxID=1573823 RepID=UPI0029C079C7|nr:sulfatase-like hydrolase/transferase [uncultured Draconibacterium sp.]
MNFKNKTLSIILVLASLASVFSIYSFTKKKQSIEEIKPNILYVYADQWRRMAMSYYSDPRFDNTYNQGDPVHTPHIDRCAVEGMIFHNAVACSPICSPNRASLITGQYPTTHGLIANSNYENFKFNNETIAHVLKENGYETAHIGKWHMAMDENHWLDDGKYYESEKRGFDYWYGSPGHNHQHFDTRLYHAKDEIDGRGEYTPGGKVLPNPFFPSKDYADKEISKEECWNPNHLTRKALDYLENSYEVRDNKKPFALYISYNPPHTIHGPKPVEGNQGSWHIAGKKEGDEYHGKRSPGPENMSYRAPMEFEKEYRDGANHSDAVKAGLRKRPNVPKDHYSRTKCLPGYYGAVNSVDYCFGQLDEYLANTPDPRYPNKKLKETTIVIITADHGEMMGSQGRMTKGIPMEESIAVPFIIRWPEHVPAGSEQSEVFNSVHVAPSLLGMLGYKFSEAVDGVDNSALFFNKKNNNSPYAFLELRNWRAVRTANDIYIAEKLSKKEYQFTYYNLQEDPFQMNPLILSPNEPISDIVQTPRLKVLHNALRKHLKDIEDPKIQLKPFVSIK